MGQKRRGASVHTFPRPLLLWVRLAQFCRPFSSHREDWVCRPAPGASSPSQASGEYLVEGLGILRLRAGSIVPFSELLTTAPATSMCYLEPGTLVLLVLCVLHGTNLLYVLCD